MEQRIIIEPDTFFFNNVFTPVCKQTHFPKKEVSVSVLNRERSEKLKNKETDLYHFYFDYPDNNDEVIGVEVFKIIS